VFVPGRPFQPSVMFVVKAGAYPRVRVGSSPDEHSSLFCEFVSHEEKSYLNTTPLWSQVKKLFYGPKQPLIVVS